MPENNSPPAGNVSPPSPPASPPAGNASPPAGNASPPSPPTPPVQSTGRKFRYNDVEHELTDDQVDELLRMGADTLTKQQKEALEKERITASGSEPEEEETELQAMRRELNETKETIKKLSSSQAQRQITEELNEALGVDFVKENPELKDIVKDLTLVEAQRNPRKKLSEHVTNVVKKMEDWSKSKTAKAIEKKVQNNNRTRGTSSTSSASAMAGAGKLTGDDLFSGKVKKAAMEAAAME